VDDLGLRAEGAIGLGLLLGIAAWREAPSDPPLRRWLARGLLATATVVALGLAATAWHPARVDRADAEDHRAALLASRRAEHAAWHALHLIRAGSIAPGDVEAVRARLGPYLALRWYRPPLGAQRWADLHPLDLSQPAWPDPVLGPRQTMGQDLRHALMSSSDPETLERLLATALEAWPHDPCLTWSLVRVRAVHPEMVDALVGDWTTRPVSILPWQGADATLHSGLVGLPGAALERWRARLDARRQRDPRAEVWIEFLEEALTSRDAADSAR